MAMTKVPQSFKQAAALLANMGMFTGTRHNRGRVRTGKTAKDHKSGAWKQRFENRNRPIRCTSSHNPSQSIERSASYWQG